MAPDAERLVPRHVFIYSPPRPGSTLLRRILGSNSYIHAPQELHLLDVTVRASGLVAPRAIGALGMTNRDLEHLLWDRLLHYELARSGKRVLVEKTPSNVLSWRRIRACWPGARYIFLIRHPAHIAASLARLRDVVTCVYGYQFNENCFETVLQFAQAMDKARAEMPGPSVS